MMLLPALGKAAFFPQGFSEVLVDVPARVEPCQSCEFWLLVHLGGGVPFSHIEWRVAA